MNKKKKSACIKERLYFHTIWFLFMLVTCFFVLASESHAAAGGEGKQGTLLFGERMINLGIERKPFSGNSWMHKHDIIRELFMDGEAVFCIQEIVRVNSDMIYNQYNIQEWLPEAVVQRLSLVAYYGYHIVDNPEVSDYVFSQLLIWELLGGETISYGRIEESYLAWKKDILYKVEQALLKPSFHGQTIEGSIGETISLIDENRVLDYYDVVPSDNYKAFIEDNALHIEIISDVASSIELVRRIGQSDRHGYYWESEIPDYQSVVSLQGMASLVKSQVRVLPHSPSIQTDAWHYDTGNQTILPLEEILVVDTIAYENLLPGLEYQLEGRIYHYESREPLQLEGRIVESSLTFTPDKASGSVDVLFPFSAKELGGQRLVIFERLLLEGEEVASHQDFEEERQTIRIEDKIDIHTTAYEKDSKEKEAKGKEVFVIVDEVQCNSLVVGREYSLHGLLMDKSTKHPLLIEGEEVRSQVVFVAANIEEKIELEFQFDASKIGDREIVVFERLFDKDQLVALHEDIENANQTVRVKKPPIEEPKEEEPKEEEPKTEVKKPSQVKPKAPKAGSGEKSAPRTEDASQSTTVFAFLGSVSILLFFINLRRKVIL